MDIFYNIFQKKTTNLVTSETARFVQFGIVPFAIDKSIAYTIGQIDEQLKLSLIILQFLQLNITCSHVVQMKQAGCQPVVSPSFGAITAISDFSSTPLHLRHSCKQRITVSIIDFLLISTQDYAITTFIHFALNMSGNTDGHYREYSIKQCN